MLYLNTHIVHTPNADPDDPGWTCVQDAIVPSGTPTDTDTLTAFLAEDWATMPAGGPFPHDSCSFRVVIRGADQDPQTGERQQVGYAQITV